jgi:hypothetical protein
MKTRNIIERSFGLLKSRFGCIDTSGGTLLYTPLKCCDIVIAVVVLHQPSLILLSSNFPQSVELDQIKASCVPPGHLATMFRNRILASQTPMTHNLCNIHHLPLSANDNIPLDREHIDIQSYAGRLNDGVAVRGRLINGRFQ